MNLNWLTLIWMFNRYMSGNWSKSQHLFTEVHNYETLKTQVKCSYKKPCGDNVALIAKKFNRPGIFNIRNFTSSKCKFHFLISEIVHVL